MKSNIVTSPSDCKATHTYVWNDVIKKWVMNHVCPVCGAGK